MRLKRTSPASLIPPVRLDERMIRDGERQLGDDNEERPRARALHASAFRRNRQRVLPMRAADRSGLHQRFADSPERTVKQSHEKSHDDGGDERPGFCHMRQLIRRKCAGYRSQHSRHAKSTIRMHHLFKPAEFQSCGKTGNRRQKIIVEIRGIFMPGRVFQPELSCVGRGRTSGWPHSGAAAGADS